MRTMLMMLVAIMMAACANSPFTANDRVVGEWTPVQALHDPQAQGAAVIWGGQIIQVHNRADTTEIEVLSLPLNRSHQPRVDDEPGIRFVVVTAGFLEPVLYAPGRYISVLGRVNGERRISEGETLLLAPRLTMDEHHLWPVDQRDWRSRVHFGIGVGIHL